MTLSSPSPAAPPPSNLILGVDALRLFAAFAVVMFHLSFKFFVEPFGVTANPAVLDAWRATTWYMTWWGWVGVQLFFVVSGLVISTSAQGAPSAGAFLRRRFLRLFPALLICATLVLAVEITFFGRAPVEAVVLWLRTIVFFPQHPWIMGQFWTIGIEISFYVLVFVLVLLRRVSWLPAVGCVLIVLCSLYWAVRIGLGGTDPLGRITQLILLQHGAYFGLGILLAQCMTARLTLGHKVSVMLALMVSAAQIWMSAGWEGGKANVDWAWPVAYGVFLVSIALVYVSVRTNTVLVAGWVGGYASAVRTAGLMTYPLYLVHNHVGKPVLAGMLNAGFPPFASVTCAIGAAVAVSWVVAKFAEPWVYGKTQDVLASLPFARKRST